MILNLLDPKISYMIGFIMSDGHLSKPDDRNRGKMEIEIAKKDIAILKEIALLIECNYYIKERTRNTNFIQNYTSCRLSVYDMTFRQELKRIGIPEGNKSQIIDIPKVEYKDIDFWRGIIDGDGSVGFTKTNKPFVSLITTSENLKNQYENFLKNKLNVIRNTNKNKRDSAYNISVNMDDAKNLVKMLYYPNCLSLQRKKEKAEKIKLWQRPDNIRQQYKQQMWNQFQDEYILKHSIQESINELNRTKQSVSLRLWRLKNKII